MKNLNIPLFIAVAGMSVIPSIVSAQSVGFDVPALVEGSDITDSAFSELHPREKLVSFSFDLAVDFGLRASPETAAILVQLHTTQADLPIVDFNPRTLADSEIDGVVSIESIDESSSAIGFQLDSGPAFPWHAATNASMGGKTGQSVKYDKKPQQQLLISSGLMNRSSSVFFKFFRSPLRPLEGTHSLEVTLRMPATWRTGFLRLECAAVVEQSGFMGDQALATTGKREFLIPILLAGDSAARTEALSYRRAENALRSAAAKYVSANRNSSLWTELSRWSRVEKKPGLSQDWLAQVTGSLNVPASEETVRLPKDVSIALKDYLWQRKRFLAVKGESDSGSAMRHEWTTVENH